MLALGTGLIVLITVAGVGLGFAGGWFCFKYARRKNIFNDTDREYFQNLLFRAETAEEKLTKTELNLAKTGDRADILESSHRVIQDELAEERQNSQMLTAELTRERATRKTIEETIESHQKALSARALPRISWGIRDESLLAWPSANSDSFSFDNPLNRASLPNRPFDWGDGFSVQLSIQIQ